MSQRQERIAAFIALAVLIAIVSFLCITAAALVLGRLTGNSLPGSAYLALIQSQEVIRSTFGVVLIIITVGVNILSRQATTSRMVYLSSGLCVAGLTACFLLLVMLRQPALAQPVWNRSAPMIGYDELQSRNLQILTLIAAWLGAFLASQLGIRLVGGTAPGADAGAADPISPAEPPSGAPSRGTRHEPGGTV